ncbi:MAG: methyl-accepting chemotaxis protein [Myxococcota bacterium]|nr:methyl-accepting chemotaxis protein [Myxococcota bacterium]
MSRTSQIVSDVGNKSESVASVGGAVSKHADRLEAALKRLLEQTTQLVGELSEQHDIADSGQNEAAVAAREASGILSNTEISQNETEQLLSVADLGIDRIEALQTAISTIRTDVKRAAGIITKLSDQSRQIGSFALAISKIARHTHVLALNAAIEAAHADEHGQGFAVVAEQVRTLAGEAGGSARDVSNLIGEVQAGIEDAAEVMVAGSERIERITMLTNEAHDTLDDMHMRASQLSQELSTSAEKSASQPRSLVGLTERLTILARFTEKCSREVEETKEMISVEASAIEDLQQASSQISGLAEEFRGILS